MVGEVVAVLTADEDVLARFGGRHEAGRLPPAHDPRLGLDEVRLETAALPDSLVRDLVRIEAPVEPGLVAVERVRVLHDELTHAQEPAAWPRLVPLLRREVVPELRQLLVRLQLARVERHRLLVRERQHEVAPVPVLEMEHDRDADAAARLPQLGRRQHRLEHLLTADRVDLLADDLHHLLVHPPAEGQERPEPGADLTDEASAHEQLVARCFGVRGRLAQGRKEKL
jgi:hypothetical protein